MAQCISPLLIRKDGRRDIVPCGKCNFCLESKRADWSFRLNQELKAANTAAFLTLTYTDESVPLTETGELTLRKEDLQLWLKRLRKDNSKKTDWPIRYYAVGEYGTKTERPHYHSILFNAVPGTDFSKTWPHGSIVVGEVNQATIHYTTKYVINRHMDDLRGREPPKALMSRRPGLGINYLQSHQEWHLKCARDYTQVNGIIRRMPRYYREKVFSKFQREIFAAQKAGENVERYWEEIERLKKFHKNPEAYLEEKINHAHERVKQKVNEFNKF